MKKICFLIVLAACAMPSHSYAWFWSTNEAPKETVVEDPVLEVQIMEHASTFNKLVKGAPHEEFVLCSDCPQGMPLERDMAEVGVVIRMSAEPLVVEQVAAADPVATRPEVAVPAPLPPVNPVIDASNSVPERSLQPVPEQPLQEKSYSDPKVPGDLTEKAPGSCLSPPIHFALDKAVITNSELDRIKSVEGLLKNSKNIEVKGYTCSLGSKDHNDKLAMKRATAVAEVLKQMGITPSSVTSEGKCCYVSEDKAQNRRVEITCVQNP